MPWVISELEDLHPHAWVGAQYDVRTAPINRGYGSGFLVKIEDGELSTIMRSLLPVKTIGSLTIG